VLGERAFSRNIISGRIELQFSVSTLIGRKKASMQKMKLDETDRRILADLQAEGRMTNVELAHRVGISAPPCLRRVRALEKAGFIRGYHADLNAEALGFGVTVFALVGLNSQAEADLLAFERRVAGWPMVRECYMLAGEVDFVLKIVAKDWDAYQNFLTRELTAAPSVAHVKTSLTIRVSKSVPGVPIDQEVTRPAAPGSEAAQAKDTDTTS
jgi:DNA-binding Lrp family transcriptional regulator